jgi:NADP-dependent 3-hydroxy acid dehydrogenase YdfG
MSNALRNVALITGAGSGSGIGAAVAARLLGDGYTVYGTSRKVETSASRPPGLVMRAIDVRDESAVVALVDGVGVRSKRVRSHGHFVDIRTGQKGRWLRGWPGIERKSQLV